MVLFEINIFVFSVYVYLMSKFMEIDFVVKNYWDILII